MKFFMGRFAAVVAATALAACQFPGFPTSQQAARPAPPPRRAEPPAARGIWMVGAPTVEPRLRAVSAAYEPTPDTKPTLSAEGTAQGLRALCAGTGVEHPDMALADRAIRAEEARRCAAKGIALTEYALGPKRFVYVKDAHMAAIPGVRDFVGSWGMQGKPVGSAAQPS